MNRILKIRREVLIAVVSFIVGLIAMYFYDSTYLSDKKQATDMLIENSRQTYDAQRKISENYKSAFDQLYSCIITPSDSCEPEITIAKFKDIQVERDKLLKELDKLNKETEAIMARLLGQR